MNRWQIFLMWGIAALFTMIIPKIYGKNLRYKGVNYVSWTRGEYPYTYSWKAQTYWDSQAIISVAVTSEGTLELVVDSLCSLDPQRKNGEAFVDLIYYPPLWEPPFCMFAPLDMFGDTISAMVYCPIGSHGTDSAPNGLQLFVKDHNGKSFYGSWNNIEWWEQDTWKEVIVVPDLVAPIWGYMDPGFDPTKIISLGIKIGANESSPICFSGIFYLDNVRWSNYYKPIYDFENVENSIEILTRDSCNFVSLVVTWYMVSATANSIAPDILKTHTDEEIIETIEYLDSLGIGIMLKPHVDVKDDTWRGEIEPADKNAWFNSYAQFITHYAQIAARKEVDVFCIGTELKSLSDSNYRSKWDEIINLIKNEYNGMLTYAAHWYGFQNVSFWDKMDIIGINAYFPLSNLKNPPIDSLILGWTGYFDGEEMHNWVGYLEGLNNIFKKPIIFTEIGYGSHDYAAREPRALPERDSSLINCALQARCYEAAFKVLECKDWFQGMFWWMWHPFSDAGGPCNLDLTPQNKPAEDILRKCYSDSESCVVVHKETPNLPVDLYLMRNYPNPFNSETIININLPYNTHTLLQIFNINGQIVRTLINSDLSSGNHKIIWDGRNQKGQHVSSGIYLYFLKTDFGNLTRKMLLLR